MTKVRIILAAGSSCFPHGCILSPMDEISTSLRESSLESHHSSATKNHVGTSSSNHSRSPSMAQCFLVPDSLTIGHMSSSDSPTTTGGTNNFSSPSNTSELESLRVAIIRNQLESQQLNDQAIADLLHQRLAPTPTNKGYRKIQLRFLAWAQLHTVPYTTFSGNDLVNFLADMRHSYQLKVSTLKTVRAAVSRLHADPQRMSADQLVNSYLDTLIKQGPPVVLHRCSTIDLTPALVYARSVSSRPATNIKQLQQKPAFLLAMAAFLRPSDLARIPFSSCSISTDDGCLRFEVVAPKETRGKRRIIKSFRVHLHATDHELCPIKCFKAVRGHPALIFCPSGSNLFVKSNNIHQPLSSSTLFSWLHRHFIALCTTESGVSIRSLASSRALDLGVSRDDIVTPGNWATSSTFVNHYQRNQMANVVDFTSTVLSAPSQDEFFDAMDSFSLD